VNPARVPPADDIAARLQLAEVRWLGCMVERARPVDLAAEPVGGHGVRTGHGDDRQRRARSRYPLKVRARIAELPADRFPNLIAVAEHFHYADSDQSFELLIDLFVDGLAARVST
jgi:hypothetical protein